MDGQEIACACGSHCWLAHGEPDSVTWCHCDDCRRESGAPAFVWVGWREDRVDGDVSALAVRTTKPGVERGRCGECGSTLLYRDRGLSGLIYVPLGAHAEPTRLRPTEHAFWTERMPWLAVADEHPKRDKVTRKRVALD